MSTGGIGTWDELLDALESDVQVMEQALAADGDLPELTPFDPGLLGAVPDALRQRAVATLEAVMQLERTVADRLDAVARELSGAQIKLHDSRPSYGGLDVSC